MTNKFKAAPQSIGIIDYGIGGLGLYRLLKTRKYQAPIVYLSDAGVQPYGTLSRKELALRLDRVIDFYREIGVTRVVVACNAASTVLPRPLPPDMEVLGFIEFGVQSVLRSKSKEVLLIGGGRTVKAGLYRKKLLATGIKVQQKNTQPLSIMIEAGDVASLQLVDAVSHYLKGIRPGQSLLLACTHYPAILPIFRNVLGPEFNILDPAEEAAESIVCKWKYVGLRTPDQFFTTGDPFLMKSAASLTFNISLTNITLIKL